jgi:drug/metabolite transporter (DMT)-like permease
MALAGSAPSSAERQRALGALILACLFWGTSFPVTKALALRAELLAPSIDTWFIAGATVAGRYTAAALVLSAVSPLRLTRSEIVQGLWLGVSAAFGVLLQADGMAYTEASTSAFLTTGYAFLLPLLAFATRRERPSARVLVCVVLMVLGIGILSGFEPESFSIGRGELETLLASVCFAFQIMALDQPRFASNRTGPVTTLMFVVVALIALPVALTRSRPGDFRAVLGNAPSLVLFAALFLFSTLGAFVLMNRYQKWVSASEAGVIYGMEPVFASLLALFVPELLSSFTAISYPNETLDARLLVGGGLVVFATVALSLFERRVEREDEASVAE